MSLLKTRTVAEKDFDWLCCEHNFIDATALRPEACITWTDSKQRMCTGRSWRTTKQALWGQSSMAPETQSGLDATQTINHFSHGYVLLFQFNPLTSLAVNKKIKNKKKCYHKIMYYFYLTIFCHFKYIYTLKIFNKMCSVSIILSYCDCKYLLVLAYVFVIFFFF